MYLSYVVKPRPFNNKASKLDSTKKFTVLSDVVSY